MTSDPGAVMSPRFTPAPAPLGTAEGRVTFRPFDPERDHAAVAELICEANATDGTDWLPSAETLAHELTHDGNCRPAVDALVAERDGKVAGFLIASWRQRAEKVVHGLELWVRPSARRRGIGNALVAWGERHAADRVRAGDAVPAHLPQEIGGWGDLEVAGHAELAAARGYRVVRYGMEMRRPVDAPIPDAPLPAGLEIRPVRPADHRRIWDADVEAFRDHWEAAVRTEADFEWWFSRPHLDTSLWRVAWDGDEVAGSCFNHRDPEENARLGVDRAWLGHVSVRRPWRRRGLAAALIAASLEGFRERGIGQAALGVDAENPSGAVRLYERLGFRRARTGVSYRKSLEV